jgi:hypothetical protein
VLPYDGSLVCGVLHDGGVLSSCDEQATCDGLCVYAWSLLYDGLFYDADLPCGELCVGGRLSYDDLSSFGLLLIYDGLPYFFLQFFFD